MRAAVDLASGAAELPQPKVPLEDFGDDLLSTQNARPKKSNVAPMPRSIALLENEQKILSVCSMSD